MTYFFIFFTCFIITSFSMPLIIDQLIKIGVTDRPNSRKIHKEITPRMGGVLILPLVFIFLFTYGYNVISLKYFIISSIFLLICGIIDDIIELGWKYKVVLQSLSVIFLIIQIHNTFESLSLFGIQLPSTIYYPLLFVFILGAVNSINLMDGLDGLVSGFSLLLALPVFILSLSTHNTNISIILISIVGITLGLLKYNSFPAKVFLGDTGSLSLGIVLLFCLISISIIKTNKHLDLTIPIMFFGVPLTDTLKVIFSRILREDSVFLAAKDHLHHIILGYNIRHKTVVFLIQSFSILFILNAILYIKFNSSYFYITFFLLMLVIVFIDKIMSRIINLDSIRLYYKRISLKPSEYIISQIKKFLWVSFILFCLVIGISTPYNITIDWDLKLVLPFVWMLLLILAFVNHRSWKQLNHIYSFFNFAFLHVSNSIFTISNYKYSFQLFGLQISFSNLIFFLFLLNVLLFFYARDKVIPKNVVFFTGFDLTLFTLIISTVLIREVLPINIYIISNSLFASLICYYWLKVFYFYYPRIVNFIFYTLFFLNISIMVKSLL
ncbi:MAG: UDP-N-acetylglucosamine:undecaprenyl-P N-acetylglucosaminyl 1-P transferase [Ignavibacteria bacterium]|nr:MAG: UDP-N-acetylglucosamine:undecaprenyl-P N-acetylglucosaminyl 1-P transferase [Ignavibacteria bacterium]KAF0155453.1 MAG: UDP-N-acetylglucosamine:undecaprenyl-P N-acetylglucosaminyl 1-P transferase [Ignavibacteria bacterium]